MGVIEREAIEKAKKEILAELGQGVTANAVKSVQRGIISFAAGSGGTATVQINAVNPSKAFVSHLGNRVGSTEYTRTIAVKLIDATTLEATTARTSNVESYVSYEVIEFY